MISFSSNIPHLLRDVCNALNQLGFAAKQTSRAIHLYGEENLHAFMKIIGTSNSRLTLKYLSFQQTGFIPSAKQAENLLSEISVFAVLDP